MKWNFKTFYQASNSHKFGNFIGQSLVCLERLDLQANVLLQTVHPNWRIFVCFPEMWSRNMSNLVHTSPQYSHLNSFASSPVHLLLCRKNDDLYEKVLWQDLQENGASLWWEFTWPWNWPLSVNFPPQILQVNRSSRR